MPELPEVETIRRQLKRKIIGKTIAKIEVFRDKSVTHDLNFSNKLSKKIFSDIDRVGKLMIFSFVGESDLFLLAHLRMTGQFFFVEDDDVTVGGGHSVSSSDLILPGRHTRVSFTFTDNSTLYFNDMRLFGYMKLATAKEVKNARSRFGQEPIASGFNTSLFIEKIRKRKTPIKAILLDQSLIAGLGNIYVDEALWRAEVSPFREANKVTKAEVLLLIKASGDVMNESIKVGGTTFQSFKDVDGDAGNFIKFLQVFGRQGKSCERCSDIIIKIRCAGRGTHYCPTCQK